MTKSNKVVEFLKHADRECEALIGKSDQELRDFISEYQTKFNGSIHANIYATFGDFLYNALGKKINGQVKSKLLTGWYEANKKSMVPHDGKSKEPVSGLDNIIKWLAEYNKRNNAYTPNNRKDFKISHATCGRTFGMGYVTEAGKIRSIDIPSNSIFFYLTQDHVDLIKNKTKRACAQDFLKFRDSYLKIEEEINKANVIKDISIPLQTAKLSEINVGNALNENRYGNSEEDTYLVHEDTRSCNINVVEILLDVNDENNNKFHIDRSKNNSLPMKHMFRSGKSCDKYHHIISLAIYNEPDMPKDSKAVTKFYGMIKFREKNTLTCLNTKFIKNSHMICSFSQLDDYTYKKQAFSPYASTVNKIAMGTSLPLNWVDVLKNDKVKVLLETKIKFLETASKTLEFLKKKHAKLVFMFGSF